MGSYGRFKKAKAARGPIQRFELGRYICRIEGVKFDETRKKVEIFAVSLSIEEITDGGEKMKIGQRVDWCCMEDWENYEGLVKDFICKCYDTSEQEIDAMGDDDFDEMMKLLTGVDQSATGRLIEVECIPYKNKEEKETTVTRFFPVPLDEQPQAIQDAEAEVESAEQAA